MIARYNTVSLLIGAPGLILQIAGATITNHDLGLLLQIGGGLLLIVGLAFYAMAKGRTGLWGLMGLFSLLGLIVLALLPDLAKTGVAQRPTGWAVRSAHAMGAHPVAPTQMLVLPAPIVVSVSKNVAIDRDGHTVATLPQHGSRFASQLSGATRFVAQEAAAWEPSYEWDDVAAILGMLVKIGVLELAT
jgi:hypothetical protein